MSDDEQQGGDRDERGLVAQERSEEQQGTQAEAKQEPKGASRPLVTREVAHSGLSELRVVASMHERKAQMAQLSDAFIALPGGLGTLEELFEIWTWAQLGIHRKPCGLLNAEGYYDRLLEFLSHAVAENFIEPRNRSMMTVAEGGDKLLDRLERYQDPAVPRWVAESEI